MSAEIKYLRLTRSIGRNGGMNTSGIDISLSEGDIHLFPVTSKGKIGHCLITIPLESIDEFIHQLELLRYEKEDDF